MKHYLIYQIRNKLNGMIYIGQHQTDDVNDNYMGSGIRIKRAIEKYGIENFEKTILFECSSEIEMNAKEAEIVNEDFIARDDVYNIELGGKGGWTHLSFESKSQASKKRWQNMSQLKKEQFKQKCAIKAKQWNASVNKEEWKKKISEGLKRVYAEHPEKRGTLGKTFIFSDEHKQKISERLKDPSINIMKRSRWIYNIQTLEYKIWPINEELPIGWAFGKKPPKPDLRNINSPTFGYSWINDGKINKFIKNEFINEYLNNGWVKGRLKI